MMIEKLVANLASNRVQKKTLQGREYLVAPVVMLLEGVFAGSQGPLYYSAAELQKTVAAWNARPITIGHPELPNGKKVSGCTPEALESAGVGMVLNTKFDKRSGKLKAEAWFDVQRLAALSEGLDIRKALETNRKVEVSTGLFVDALVANGEYSGKAYVARAVNHQPDHLAILLHEKGACSLEDGAGLLVNRRESRLITNEEAMSEVVEAVEEAVKKKYEPPVNPAGPYPIEEAVSIEAVYSDYVIFEIEKECFRESWTQDSNGDIALSGDRVRVVEEVTYRPVTANNEGDIKNFARHSASDKLIAPPTLTVGQTATEALVANKESTMERDQLLAALGEDHKDFIANLSDEQVAALAKLAAPKADVPADVEVAVEAPAAAEVVVEQAPVANSVADIVAAAPAHLQAQLQDALVANQRLRDGYIATIVANKANKFSPEEFAGMSLVSLEKLAEIAASPVAAPAHAVRQPIFAGSPVTNSAPVAEQGFLPPSTLG